MPANTCRSLVAATLAFVCAWSSSAAAQTSSTVAGTVKDTQGGIIPGATVTFISESRGTTFAPGRRVATGDFVISNIPADTYTIQRHDGRVQDDSSATASRSAPGERVAVGTVTIEVGTLAETVARHRRQRRSFRRRPASKSFTDHDGIGREPSRCRTPLLRAVRA